MQRPWLPEKWDVEADVVVVGFGGAGAATAITACDLGASVVILEKAAEGEAGGNTRIALQGYLNVTSVDDAITYLNAMCGPYAVPQEMVRVWADEMSKNNEWVRSIGGDPQENPDSPQGLPRREFPELPGSQAVRKFHLGDVLGYSLTWKFLEEAVRSRPAEILYEAPARELLQDGITKEIIGVRAERAGKSVFVKARKAVVLTCGGFENNQEMIRDYLPGVPYCYTSGTPHNEGDGISMALAVGADLWHMNNYAGPSMELKVPEYKTTFSMTPLRVGREQDGGMIVVGPDGKRFGDEKERTYHGKVKRNGRFVPLSVPCPMYMIMDEALFGSGPLYNKLPVMGWGRIVERYDWSDDNVAELERGWIRKADTLADLAGMIEVDAAALEGTVSEWNRMCDLGEDTAHGREMMLAPLKGGPYYAIELSPSMLNTQGGPRRNEKAEIVRPDGTPIPRLYSSGELGSIYSYLYQGTGNIGECLAFGRIAARNAVGQQPWDSRDAN